MNKWSHYRADSVCLRGPSALASRGPWGCRCRGICFGPRFPPQSHLFKTTWQKHKAPTRHAIWRGATRRSSGSPGRRGAHDPRRTRTLPDKEDPPRGASEPCCLPGLFPSSHSGFDRARSGGCLDLFHVMMSPPDERMEKAACVLDRAMRFPHALRYREYYRKKTSSKGTRSSWEPTTSKGGFITERCTLRARSHQKVQFG